MYIYIYNISGRELGRKVRIVDMLSWIRVNPAHPVLDFVITRFREFAKRAKNSRPLSR